MGNSKFVKTIIKSQGVEFDEMQITTSRSVTSAIKVRTRSFKAAQYTKFLLIN